MWLMCPDIWVTGHLVTGSHHAHNAGQCHPDTRGLALTAGGCQDDGWVKMTSGRHSETRTAGMRREMRDAPWPAITGEI